MGVFWGSFAQRQPVQSAANIAALVDMWKAGRITPHVSAKFPLERAGEAIRHLADRKAEGRVVVTVGSS